MPIALRTSILCALLSLSLSSSAQQKPSPFVKQNAPVLVLDHVRLIVQAIQIATLNGAKYMGKDAIIGSIAPGKAADIVVLGGDPAEKIENIERVELVFKDGVGYDPVALIQSVSGLVGLR